MRFVKIFLILSLSSVTLADLDEDGKIWIKEQVKKFTEPEIKSRISETNDVADKIIDAVNILMKTKNKNNNDDSTSMLVKGFNDVTEFPEEVTKVAGPRNDDNSKLVVPGAMISGQYSEITTNVLTADKDDAALSSVLLSMSANTKLDSEDAPASSKAPDNDSVYADFLKTSAFRAPGLDDYETPAKDTATVSVPMYILGRDI